jgi:hypothetical protein
MQQRVLRITADAERYAEKKVQYPIFCFIQQIQK